MEAFSLSAFFGLSYSITDAFQRAFLSGVIYNISAYCDAFDDEAFSSRAKLLVYQATLYSHFLSTGTGLENQPSFPTHGRHFRLLCASNSVTKAVSYARRPDDR